MDFNGAPGVAESANALQVHLGKVHRGRLKLDPGKVVRKLLGRIIPAEGISIKESGRDWSGYVRGLSDDAVAGADEPATQEDLDSLRRHLVEFGAAQTRRLSVRQNLSSGPVDAAPRGSVAALGSAAGVGSSVRLQDEEDYTFALSPLAKEFWPRSRPSVCRLQGALPDFKCKLCSAPPTPRMMSWCGGCGNYRPGAWVCKFCNMVSMEIDDYCRFRIHGGCPGVRAGSRDAVNDKHGPDTLRIKLMMEARKAAGAKNKVQTLGMEDYPGFQQRS